VTGLERRYRLLLRVLPGWYRAVWEQDMVATFLAGVEAEVAGDEQADLVGEYGWPDRAEVVSVLALAVRLRLGGAPAHAQSRAWGAAARRVALVVLLIHAVWSVLTVGLAVQYTLAVPASPTAPPDPVDPLRLGEWVLILAGLVWLAAYLALLAGHPHATGLAAVGLTQLAVLRVQHVLLTDAPSRGRRSRGERRRPRVAARAAPSLRRRTRFAITHTRCWPNRPTNGRTTLLRESRYPR
jgi:hypothetical protein